MNSPGFTWPDYAVMLAYFGGMMLIALRAGRRRGTADEYFLGHRDIPWYAIGLSIVATLISSLTYISEPGEVFLSGFTNILGKLIAIVLETGFVLFLFIPFLMRFRFTSAYEYLGRRFNSSARRTGVIFFAIQTVAWMGFVILAMARTMSEATGLELGMFVWVIGIGTTAYTMIGGYRGVVWTDVAQFFLMLGGALGCLAFVGWQTGSTPADWVRTGMEVHAARQGAPWVSLDPFARTSIATFALTMFVWHACIHLGNQMTVQRYFSTTDLPMARRSFLLAVAGNLCINGVLVLVGLAILHQDVHFGSVRELEQEKKADMIFPRFIVTHLPAGLAGGVLTAVLAAAMSTISSGFHSLATVVTVERGGDSPGRRMSLAAGVTLASGFISTMLAFGIDFLAKDRNIIEMMPRSFNCFTAPLGGMFLVGMFIPRVGGRAVTIGAFVSLAAAILVSYGKEIAGLERNISFTLVMPVSLAVMVAVSAGVSLVFPERGANTAGLTWLSMDKTPDIDPALLSQSGGRP